MCARSFQEGQLATPAPRDALESCSVLQALPSGAERPGAVQITDKDLGKIKNENKSNAGEQTMDGPQAGVLHEADTRGH